MEIRETAQDRMHRLIEDSSSDRAFLRSPEAESCKIYLIFKPFCTESSKDTHSRQAKTKVIKKEPQPKKWSPSQLRVKRYPPDSNITAPPFMQPK